ncbi:MAG: hypothetical protein ACKVS9_07370 [Phycisphaerae bacterium]
MRGFVRCGRFLSVHAALAACFGLAVAPAAAQDGNATTQPATATPADRLIQLNKALAALEAGDDESARAIFVALADTPGAADLQITSNYYLGLFDLREGLAKVAAIRDLSSDVQKLETDLYNAEIEGRTADRAAALEALNAKRDEVEVQKRRLSEEAKTSFNSARARLERVTESIDSTPAGSRINVLRSGLLLGIAQLASDAPKDDGATRAERMDREALADRLAREAEQTLAEYVASDAGRGDRFGHFYLAVARYRLADGLLSGESRSLQEAMRVLNLGFGSLETAGKLPWPDGTEESAEIEWAARVGYYRALLFIQRAQFGDYESSIQELDRVLNTLSADDNKIRPSAQQVRDKLAETIEIGPDTEPLRLPVPAPIGPLEFDARLNIGNGFDSNVILQGRDTALPYTIKRRDDYFYGIGFDFNISRYLRERELGGFGKSLTIGMGGYTANRWQPNVSEFDVGSYGGRAFLNWQPITDLYVGLQYDYTYTTLDRDPFISSHRLTPSVTKIWRREGDDPDPVRSELGRTDLFFVWDDRNYFDFLRDERLNRDGEYQQVGIAHRFNIALAENYMAEYLRTIPAEKRRLFGRQWLSAQVGYNYRNERTEGNEFDMYSHGLSLLLTVPLPYRFVFEFSGEWSWDNYGQLSAFDFERKERYDFVQTYSAGLTYVIFARGEGTGANRTLDIRLRGGIQVTIQDSNIWDRLGQDIYEYDREIYGIGLEIRF